MKKLILFSLMAIAIQSQAQNVGIGTATPATANKLHVHRAEAGQDASIGITNSLTTDANLRGARLRMLNSDFFLQNYETTGKLGFYTNSNNRMTIASDGKVGIGIDPASTALLEVNGDTKINGEVNRPSTGAANMVPIAFGTISADGTLRANSGNVTCIKTDLGTYQITITGESYFYLNYITTATTLAPTASPRIIDAGSVSGNLIISIYNLSGTLTDSSFSFTTFKP